MSTHSPKSLLISSVGTTLSSVLISTAARSQAKDNSEDSLPTESTAANANRQLQKFNPNQPVVAPGSTAVNAGQYTFVVPTHAAMIVAVVVGGVALFPVVSLLLNAKKAAKSGQESFLAKFSSRFRKPTVLESDKFLHQRNFDKLTQISNQAESLNADKFGNTEFMVFFKIKSYIARSIDEYANLDNVIDMLSVAVNAQHSFLTIDSTESRYCSSGQQELYKFVNGLLIQDLDPTVFQESVAKKLQEVLPLLKTEEGKIALEAYVKEVSKISNNPLGLRLLLLFKKYQLDDYSTLRSVSNTIAQLDSEDLLNIDSLLLLVMVKYDVFEKLGPIVGVEEKYNRPETYSKMLQYIGLKSRHETSYQKFQEFLALLKHWETHYKSVINVRQKYSPDAYRLPKEFTAEVPGLALHEKYKESFHLIAPVAATATALSKTVEIKKDDSVLTNAS